MTIRKDNVACLSREESSQPEFFANVNQGATLDGGRGRTDSRKIGFADLNPTGAPQE